MAQASRHTARAKRTRAAILEAAELLFAERGFEATRLEDVAEAVGIRRASIVYYFRDKRELYDAVLAGVFGDFSKRAERAMLGPGSLAQRIEAAVTAWVQYVGERPALVRLLLREVADASPQRRSALLPHLRPFFELAERVQRALRASDLDVSAPVDPVHFASAIAGTTVFFVAAMPALVPDLNFDPLSPRQLERHRQDLLRIARRLLGTPGPRLARAPRSKGGSKA